MITAFGHCVPGSVSRPLTVMRFTFTRFKETRLEERRFFECRRFGFGPCRLEAWATFTRAARIFVLSSSRGCSFAVAPAITSRRASYEGLCERSLCTSPKLHSGSTLSLQLSRYSYQVRFSIQSKCEASANAVRRRSACCCSVSGGAYPLSTGVVGAPYSVSQSGRSGLPRSAS